MAMLKSMAFATKKLQMDSTAPACSAGKIAQVDIVLGAHLSAPMVELHTWGAAAGVDLGIEEDTSAAVAVMATMRVVSCACHATKSAQMEWSAILRAPFATESKGWEEPPQMEIVKLVIPLTNSIQDASKTAQ